MAFKAAPLNTSFMLAGLLGLLVSAFYIYPVLDPSWGFAFAVVFFAMIIASLISMIRAPARGQLMPKLEQEIEKGARMKIPKPPKYLVGSAPEKKARKKKAKKKSRKKKKR